MPPPKKKLFWPHSRTQHLNAHTQFWCICSDVPNYAIQCIFWYVKKQFILDLSSAMKSVKSFKLVTYLLKTDGDHLRKQGTNITCHAEPAEYGNK